MKNVGFCGVVFLSSHSDQTLCIFVQTFRKITIKIRSVRLAQHMLNPSRSLEGLQMQIPNANRRVRRLRGDNFSGLWPTRNSSPSLRRQNFSTNFTEANSVSVTIAPDGNI